MSTISRKPGDYHTFDFLNEAIIVLRGDDGVVRAFHNVCRHRASRLVDGPVRPLQRCG